MSSSVGGDVGIGPIVVLAGAAGAAAAVAAVMTVAGVGFVAWQGGKLAVEVGAAMHQYSTDKKFMLEEQEKKRKEDALKNHQKLVATASGLLAEIERQSLGKDEIVSQEMESLKQELKEIISKKLPGDTEMIEGVNLAGFSRIQSILGKQKKLGELQLRLDANNRGNQESVHDIMKELRVSMMSASIRDTRNKSAIEANPDQVERNKLNERLARVSDQIVDALEHVAFLSENFGMEESSERWFHSCFDGIDDDILELSGDSISLDELKEGIIRLEDKIGQYNIMIPTINSSCERMKALYDVYAETAKLFGMKVIKISKFKSQDEIEEQLKVIESRMGRAQECADIYRSLGKNGYICYAWDQELSALGYKVHSRKEIMKLANVRPEKAKVGEEEIPFYKWSDNELTQLYSISDECHMQLIVHKDGTVSMQTLGEKDLDAAAEATKKLHCDKMKQLYENLRKNWFLIFDYEEIKGAQEVIAANEWFQSSECGWNHLEPIRQQEFIEGRAVADRKDEHQHEMHKK